MTHISIQEFTIQTFRLYGPDSNLPIDCNEATLTMACNLVWLRCQVSSTVPQSHDVVILLSLDGYTIKPRVVPVKQEPRVVPITDGRAAVSHTRTVKSILAHFGVSDTRDIRDSERWMPFIHGLGFTVDMPYFIDDGCLVLIGELEMRWYAFNNDDVTCLRSTTVYAANTPSIETGKDIARDRSAYRCDYQCSRCNTRSIYWEGTVYFDPDTQSMQASDECSDTSDCGNCGAENTAVCVPI